MHRERPNVVFLHHQTLADRAVNHVLCSLAPIELVASIDLSAWSVHETQKCTADVVLLSCTDDLAQSCDLIRFVKSAMPDSKLLAIGMLRSDAPQLISAGAAGCVSYAESLVELLQTIMLVHQRKAEDTIRKKYNSMPVSVRGAGAETVPARNPISQRETEVLRLIANAKSNKEIADVLNLSVSTVKNHVHNILGKLGVARRRDAMRWAYMVGLVETPFPAFSRILQQGFVPLQLSHPDKSNGVRVRSSRMT
jgi:DNA-binding NarL/FixJ family response regulator